jgi:hypothetical protein
MYYSYVEIEYIATSFSPARTDLALKLLRSNGCDTKKEIMRLKKDLQMKDCGGCLVDHD